MVNREIKFRLWNKREKNFVENPSKYQRLAVCPEGRGVYIGEYDFCDADKYLIQQFTDIKDINGCEIYEGDVVTYQLNESTSEHDTVRFVVEWGDCAWIMQDIDLKCCVGYLTCAIKTYEVIGNIFENPELCAK